MVPVELGKASTDVDISSSFNTFMAANAPLLSGPNFAGGSFRIFIFNRAASRPKCGTNRRNTFDSNKKDMRSVMLDGSWSLGIASVV